MESGKIHRITIGRDPNNGISYRVGQKLTGTGIRIDGIHADYDHFVSFGVLRHVISVVTIDKDGKDMPDAEPFIWQSIIGGDLVIQYDFPDK